jgi:hypothetical protein
MPFVTKFSLLAMEKRRQIMRKLVLISLVLALVVSFTTAFSESGDGVDWAPLVLDEFMQEIRDVLGYVPTVTFSTGASGKYGVITIKMPNDDVQRMVMYQSGTMYMSSQDRENLLNGELDEYVSRFKNTSVSFYKAEDDDTVFTASGLDLYIVTSPHGGIYLNFGHGKPSYDYALYDIEEFDDYIVVSGEELSQAIYWYNTADK